MNVLDFEQRSPEWFAARAGKVTASRIADVLAKIKSGEAAARRNYKAQLVAEIISGMPQDNGFVTADMQYGIDMESEARAAYEAEEGVLVEQVGMVQHPRIERAAASPDGCVGDAGLVEIKVPKLATHLAWLLAGVVPSEHHPQMLWQMACCERDWNDFASYRPDLPDALRLFRVRLDRDNTRIREMEAETVVFLAEVDEMVAKLKARMK